MELMTFIEKYTDDLAKLLKGIDKQSIQKIVQAFEKTAEKGSKIYVIGNGGGAPLHLTGQMILP